MSNRRSPYALESLENRTMMAFAGQVAGYYYIHSNAALAKLDLSGLTQLNYAFLTFNTNGTINPFTGTALTQMTSAITAAHAKGVKVNIVADNAISTYESIMADSAKVSTFTTQLVNYAKQYNFDGIDLDWEDFSATSAQITQYGTLLQTMHTATAANGLTLSAAVISSQKMVPTSAFSSLDWFNVMDYDLLANSSAPLAQSKTYMNNWAGYGVPKSKLLMGVPFYGRSAPGGSNDWANSSTKTYSSIASDYLAQYGTPIPTNLDSVTLSGTAWGYSGADSMTAKVEWMKTNGFGGMMIWELTQDAWNSSSQYTAQSLLPAIKKAMTIPFATLASGSLTITQSLAAGAVSLSLSGTTLSASDGTSTYTFANASTTKIIYAGTANADSLTLNSGVTQPLTFNGGTGSDTLTFNGTYASTTNLGSGSTNLAVVVTGGGFVTLSGQQTFASLTSNGTTRLAAGAASVLNVTALTLGGSGKLDLNDNAMVLNYAATSPVTAITALLKTGSGNSDWTGIGITSGVAASTPNTLLGLAEASTLYSTFPTTFANQAIDATSLLIRYTYAGDANLDGKIDIVDLGILAGNYGATPRTFSEGDFNYDGKIDIVDLGMLSGNWQKTMPGVTLPSDPLAVVTTKPVVSVPPKKTARV